MTLAMDSPQPVRPMDIGAAIDHFIDLELAQASNGFTYAMPPLLQRSETLDVVEPSTPAREESLPVDENEDPVQEPVQEPAEGRPPPYPRRRRRAIKAIAADVEVYSPELAREVRDLLKRR